MFAANSPIPITSLQKRINKMLSVGDIVSLPNQDKGKPPIRAEVIHIYPSYVRFKNTETGLATCVLLFDALNLTVMAKKPKNRAEEEDIISAAMTLRDDD